MDVVFDLDPMNGNIFDLISLKIADFSDVLGC